MKVKAIRTHYEFYRGSYGLEDTLNNIGYENVLQILPCYCGMGEYFYTIIYKEEKENVD